MRAVNLIPPDAPGSGAPAPTDVLVTVYAVLGGLAVALILMIIYVTTGNTISERQAQLVTLQQQVSQTQSALGQLTSYVQFQQLAQTREQTVKQIAGGRYDWAGIFSQLARVVPRNATLATVNATLSPSSSSGGGGSGLRSDIQAPALELNGCTSSQVAVARLMSRLRLMPGVTRVTLSSSSGATSSSSTPATPPAAGGSTISGASSGCGTGPSFDILVFLTPPGSTGATGATGAAGTAP